MLAIVLVLIFVLITAVYAFQRRAIVDTSIVANRMRGAEADALARGHVARTTQLRAGATRH